MRLQSYLREGIEDKGIFKAMFMAGHPGAGKSYVLRKVKSGQVEPRLVNTDKTFPLFKEWWSTDWPKISTKVKTINKNQLALYINSMLPLAVDGTAIDTSQVLKRIGILESFGYDVGMIFVNTSLETALKRASKRERPVDPEFIKKVYDRVNKARSFYRTKFQTWIEIDNDDGQLTSKFITDGFKFASAFYGSPIVNPVGKDNVKVMRENGWKYLSPNIYPMERIKSATNAWYNF
jgi:tRNA uridine 5-carbamoylmethylation protein Kti12